MSMVNHVVIGVETPRIYSRCFLEKEFTQLIHTNRWIILYLVVNQVESCYGCVRGFSTWDTKDTLWMDDRVLTMTYESLATWSLRCHRLDNTWSPQRCLSGQDEIIFLRYKRRSTHGMTCSCGFDPYSPLYYLIRDYFLKLVSLVIILMCIHVFSMTSQIRFVIVYIPLIRFLAQPR